MIPHHWRRNPADNGFSDPNADVRPGRFANTVLGSIRGLMATAAAARDDGQAGVVAALGAGNVYAVSTNEGLIDIATGINGVPAAITSPFLLRVTFDMALTGSGATPPHLKVDAFDCGPILRRDGSPLGDGDLVAGVPVLLLGDMAQATDTKVTRVRVLDVTPGDLGSGSQGQCRLVYTSPTVVTLLPYRGSRVRIGGGMVTPPVYGVYASVGANGLTLEASTTGHVTDATYGHEVKADDPTRTLVGMVALDGTAGTQGTFADTSVKRYVASYFGRRPRILTGAGSAIYYTASGPFVELSTDQRLSFLTWADEVCALAANGSAYANSDSASAHSAIGVDGAVPLAQSYSSFGSFGYSAGAGISVPCVLSEGFHYATLLGQSGNGRSVGFNVQTFAQIRS